MLALSLTSCGYRPAFGAPVQQRLTVGAAPSQSPQPEAVEALLAGLRAGLSEAGALAPGTEFPRVFVELLRVDELPAGIQATPVGGGSQPLATGAAVGVVARAWIVTTSGAGPSDDTGDIRRVEYVAQGSDSLTGAYAYAGAVRGAARRVGESLAHRILGGAEPGTDPM